MKKTIFLSSLFVFANLYSAQEAILHATIQFPVLDGIVKDDLVEQAADKGVVMFVGALADLVHVKTIRRLLGQYNIEFNQEIRGRAEILATASGHDFDMIARLISQSAAFQKTILFKAKYTVNTAVEKYLAGQAFNQRDGVNEEEVEDQITYILNNQ